MESQSINTNSPDTSMSARPKSLNRESFDLLMEKAAQKKDECTDATAANLIPLSSLAFFGASPTTAIKFAPKHLTVNSIDKAESDMTAPHRTAAAPEISSKEQTKDQKADTAAAKTAQEPQKAAQNQAVQKLSAIGIPTPLFAASSSVQITLPAGATIDIETLSAELVRTARMLKKDGKTEIFLNLEPKELGKVLLSISSKDGVLTITLGANPEVQKILSDQLAELKAALKASQLNIGSLQVDIGGFAQSKFTAAMDQLLPAAKSSSPLWEEPTNDLPNAAIFSRIKEIFGTGGSVSLNV